MGTLAVARCGGDWADQLSKAAIVATLREGGGWAVTGFFSLILTYNTGAAFSFLATGSGWQRWVLAAIAVAPRS